MVLCQILFKLILFAKFIKLGSALCSSIDYSTKIKSILSQQNEYDVYEGKLVFLQNKPYPQQNPNGIYGAIYFNDPKISTYDLTEYSYFLRASNALIFSGCTPPKSKYFSFVSYINNRYHYIENNESHHSLQLFADLGACLNNLVWNTSSKDISLNYDSLTTVIQTADEKTYNYIYNLLTVKNNISSSEMNLQSLPNEYIKFTPYECNYNDEILCRYTYDTGMWLFRITLTMNTTEYKQYINRNQTVFMLQPKSVKIKNNTQPQIPYNIDIRNTYSSNNFNETSSVYSNILNQYKHDLINYLTTTYDMKFEKEAVFNDPFGKHCVNQTACYGFKCIQEMTACYGDNRDALYSGPGSLYIDNKKFYIMLGVIHSNHAIKQTIYSNIAYYLKHSLTSNTNPAINNNEYNGSGLILPVNTSVSKEYLQNIFVVQSALYKNCIYIGQLSDKLCIRNTTKVAVEGTIEQRNYLNPITKTRPNYYEIIPSILLNFTLLS